MRYLVTSALPYVHGVPHLGNLVGSIFPADVTARFLRLAGEEVIYICGSDMHGSPLEVAAFRQGRDVKEMAYEQHERIKTLLERFLISTDHYGHTDTEENKETTYEIFWALWENGYIKKEKITLAYCEGHGGFLADRWVEGTCPHCGGLARGDQCDDCGAVLSPEEIVRPKCVYCGSDKITFRETEQLVIDLPALEGELKEFYEERKDNWPVNARKTTEWYLYEKGLKPRSITRHLRFGFPVPLEGFEDQVFYVWFDAPLGYIGITREWAKKKGAPDAWKEWWMGKDVMLIQYMGKDNIFFHTILWPAMLIGSRKKYVLPHVIASAEYLKAKDVKFSKSRGVGLNIESALEILPAEYWRFVLAATFPSKRDMEFSWEILVEKINKELADDIGNFVHRTVSLWNRFFGEEVGDVPLGEEERKEMDKVFEKVDEIERHYRSWLGFQEVVREAVVLASEGNAWLNAREPWKEVKEDTEKARRTLYVALHYVKALAVVLTPILPESGPKIMRMLGYESYTWKDAKEEGIRKVGKSEILFRKIDEKQVEEWKGRFSEKEEKKISIDDFLGVGLLAGKVLHVQETKSDRKLLTIEHDGKKYRAVTVLSVPPESVKGRVVLFLPLDGKEIVEGIEVNAHVPTAAGVPIISEKGVTGKVR